MILYVNGDSHSAAAEAVNPHAFAEDDSQYQHLGRAPHPDNLKVSYGQVLADLMSARLVCEAESASSNNRIIRSTWSVVQGVQGLPTLVPDYVVIGWSTWERKEFYDLDTNKYWQVSAGGVGFDWPDWLKQNYKKFISEIDYQKCMEHDNRKIHQFHLDLQNRGIRHLFFNTFSSLQGVEKLDWHGCYLGPYNEELTYYNWLLAQGFKTVNPNSYHFGPDAHKAWGEFLYQELVMRKLTQ